MKETSFVSCLQNNSSHKQQFRSDDSLILSWPHTLTADAPPPASRGEMIAKRVTYHASRRAVCKYNSGAGNGTASCRRQMRCCTRP